MNEHTWEKLDADMRSEMSEEYIQERCPHEFVDILDFEIVNAGEDALITIGCDKCGATQQHTLDLEEIIFNLQMEWQE
jgi:hypothetical protein